jgi:hypothetical protein
MSDEIRHTNEDAATCGMDILKLASDLGQTAAMADDVKQLAVALCARVESLAPAVDHSAQLADKIKTEREAANTTPAEAEACKRYKVATVPVRGAFLQVAFDTISNSHYFFRTDEGQWVEASIQGEASSLPS